MAGEARERDLGRPLCFNAAFVLTLWALFVNSVDLASGDYASVVIQALVCSALALVLIAIRWRRMPGFARAISLVLTAANLWTLIDAGGRRLPGILGW
jgi:hypothetical protein